MKQCHHLPSDALLAPCAEEGGSFREPAPARPKPAQVEAEWPPYLIVILAVSFIVSISYFYFFGEASSHVVH